MAKPMPRLEPVTMAVFFITKYSYQPRKFAGWVFLISKNSL